MRTSISFERSCDFDFSYFGAVEALSFCLGRDDPVLDLTAIETAYHCFGMVYLVVEAEVLLLGPAAYATTIAAINV